jgi:hypothetical protein
LMLRYILNITLTHHINNDKLSRYCKPGLAVMISV